jgi:hypothetical protein
MVAMGVVTPEKIGPEGLPTNALAPEGSPANESRIQTSRAGIHMIDVPAWQEFFA